MEKAKIEEFRKILQGQLEDLLREADKTVSEMTDEKTNFPDPTDRASLESDRNFELRIRDRERKLILKIREADVVGAKHDTLRERANRARFDNLAQSAEAVVHSSAIAFRCQHVLLDHRLLVRVERTQVDPAP